MASSSYYKIVRGLATLGAYSSGRWYLVVENTELLITPKIFEDMIHGDLRHTTFVIHEKAQLNLNVANWPAKRINVNQTTIIGPSVVRILWYPCGDKDKDTMYDYIWIVNQMA